MSASNFDNSLTTTLRKMQADARATAAYNLRAARRFVKLNPRLAVSYAKKGGAWKESAASIGRKINLACHP